MRLTDEECRQLGVPLSGYYAWDAGDGVRRVKPYYGPPTEHTDPSSPPPAHFGYFDTEAAAWSGAFTHDRTPG